MSTDYSAYLNRYPDLKKAFGTDVAAAEKHYNEFGKKEGRDPNAYALDDYKNADPATNFDIDKFEGLLSRLEASKGRQQRQKSVEGRRDIFSQGLAGMMSNF